MRPIDNIDCKRIPLTPGYYAHDGNGYLERVPRLHGIGESGRRSFAGSIAACLEILREIL